jgi:prefoldin subunit 5
MVFMQERLAELKAEFERGQQHLQALDQQRAQLRDTLLRISGAIQVLEELLAVPEQNGHHVVIQETETPVEANL